MLSALLGLVGPTASSAGADAPATVPLRLLYAHAFSAVMTDGVRYAAFEPVDGTTRVIDAATGAVVDRPDPTGCAGGLVGVGSGELLYSCVPPGCVGPVLGPPSAGVVTIQCTSPPTSAYARALYVVEDIDGEALHVVAGSDRILSADSPAFDAIGSQWLASPVSGLHVAITLYLDWHTGRQVTDNRESRASADSTEDLDAPKLLRRMCAPLRRTPASTDGVGTTAVFAPLSYSPPFAASLDDASGRLSLHRCGSTRIAQLRGTGVTQFQLAGRTLAWATFARLPIPGQPALDQPGAIYAAALHSAGRHWLATTFRYTGAPAGVIAHTAVALYDSTTTTQSRYPDIYTARLRR